VRARVREIVYKLPVNVYSAGIHILDVVVTALCRQSGVDLL